MAEQTTKETENPAELDCEDDEAFTKFLQQNPNLAKMTGKLPIVDQSDTSLALDSNDEEDFVSRAEDLETARFEKTKQGRIKETFQCNYCHDLIINSRETMLSHARGRAHKEQVQEWKENYAIGRIPTLPENEITQIKNEAPLRKKVPVRLQVKLKHLPENPVGLEFVDEFLPIFSDEVEPYYECFLCDNQGESNGMANHVISSKHIEKYLQARYPHDRQMTDLNRSELSKMAVKYSQKDQLHLINVYESDLLYKWPTGKSPWCCDQGGDGIAPINSRENLGLGRGVIEKDPLWRNLYDNREKIEKNISSLKVPTSNALGECQSDQDAMEGLQFLEEMITKMMEDTRLQNATEEEIDQLEMMAALIRVRASTWQAELFIGVQAHSSGSSQSRSPSPDRRNCCPSTDRRHRSSSTDRRQNSLSTLRRQRRGSSSDQCHYQSSLTSKRQRCGSKESSRNRKSTRETPPRRPQSPIESRRFTSPKPRQIALPHRLVRSPSSGNRRSHSTNRRSSPVTWHHHHRSSVHRSSSYSVPRPERDDRPRSGTHKRSFESSSSHREVARTNAALNLPHHTEVILIATAHQVMNNTTVERRMKIIKERSINREERKKQNFSVKF